MINKKLLLGAAISSATLSTSQMASAESFTEALTGGEATGDFRLRYESVEQDNAVDDASALTLRSRLGYKTGSFNGFSALMEVEDSRIALGEGDYTVGPTGYNPWEYSVIADPEVTEVDQAFVQYKGEDFSAKLGRQVMVFDNRRFVGHVGWRQDRQTFDGVALNYKPTKELSLSYNYIGERNRIFAEEADVESKDHLFNAAYKTSVGTVTGYAYLLEVDNDTDNALDTYGVRFNGSQKSGDTKWFYSAEFATQTNEVAGAESDADYLAVELEAVLSDIMIKGGYEILGSDEDTYGFSTPLATLHKFNGWADTFLGTPSQGLQDFSLTVEGELGGGTWSVVYHDFSADESSDTVDDLGDEIDLAYSKKFGKHYNAGIKYTAYSAGDVGAGKVDADKLWLWVGMSF